MIKATLIEQGTGAEQQVQVVGGDKEAKTAEVRPLDWRGSGFWWDNSPQWTVDRISLVDLRITCGRCGEEHDPSWACPVCGWDWRNQAEDEGGEE